MPPPELTRPGKSGVCFAAVPVYAGRNSAREERARLAPGGKRSRDAGKRRHMEDKTAVSYAFLNAMGDGDYYEATRLSQLMLEIGRASCRERV